METRNILLVVASVSAFLVIVLAAGLWLFWPQAPDTQEAAVEAEPLFDERPRDFDTFEYYRGRENLPDLVEEPAEETEDLTLTFGEAEDAEETPEAETDEVAIERRSPVREETPVRRAPAPRAVATAPAPQREAPAPAAATARPAAARVPQTTTVNEYWIQAGSYKSRTRAEALSRRLSDLGIAAAVRTREVGGDTYFRVRIGPYTNKDEADKFLSYINKIEGLGDSYVSRVKRTTTVN